MKQDKRLVIKMPEKLYREIKMISAKTDKAMNLIILEAIKKEVKLNIDNGNHRENTLVALAEAGYKVKVEKEDRGITKLPKYWVIVNK